MIDSILDALESILEDQGEPQSPYWLATQTMEMRLWRAGEHDDQAALEMVIPEYGERSRFLRASDDEWAMRK